MSLIARPILHDLFDTHRRARLGVAVRLGYDKAAASYLREKGWPHDGGLMVVLACALACKAQNAGGTEFRRPSDADGCPAWPADAQKATASVIVDALDAGHLVDPR